MEGAKAKFKVIYSKDADDFLNQLPQKATHGFIKKSQKTPPKEIAKAEEIRKAYFNSKE